MIFKCMVCLNEFEQITGKHVAKHGFKTVAEYKEKYPTAETFRKRKDSKETIEQKRAGRIGKKHTQESKDKIGAKHKGKKTYKRRNR